MAGTEGWIKTDRGWRKSYTPPMPPTHGQSTLACPRVISDTMAPTEHVDGNRYDSKSAYRAVTKREGYIEVGNDPARLRPPEKPKVDPAVRRAAIEKATAQVLG